MFFILISAVFSLPTMDCNDRSCSHEFTHIPSDTGMEIQKSTNVRFGRGGPFTTDRIGSNGDVGRDWNFNGIPDRFDYGVGRIAPVGRDWNFNGIPDRFDYGVGLGWGNRRATYNQCMSLAAAQTTPEMTNAYLAQCTQYL